MPGPLATPCWLWPGAKSGWGYGYAYIEGRGSNQRAMGVHVLLYRVLVGPVPPGYHLHHRCETPHCANPEHVEPLAPAAHNRLGTNASALNARKTHCLNGHEFTAENTELRKARGKIRRRCKTCHREAERARYLERTRAAA